MNWQEEITIGMKLIKSGCLHNYNNCDEECPFINFCRSSVSPTGWEIEGEKQDE